MLIKPLDVCVQVIVMLLFILLSVEFALNFEKNRNFRKLILEWLDYNCASHLIYFTV